MRRRIVVLFLIVFLLNLLAINTLFANPITPCQYSPPTSTFTNLSLGANYRYFDDKFLATAGDVNSGRATLRYSSFYNSPAYRFDTGLNTSLSFNKGSLSHYSMGNSNYSFYFNESDLFAFGGIKLELSSAFSQGLGLNISSGSGYGRFKDVTPLAKAMRINDMLVNRKVVTRSLPDETQQDIAQWINRRSGQWSVAAIVREIEKIIDESKVLKERGLNAVEVLRIREIVEESGNKKLCGWEVKGGVGYEIMDPQGEKRDLLVTTSTTFAYPFDPYSQFRAGLDFTSSFNITKNYSLSGNLSYNYRWSDELTTRLLYSLLIRQPEQGDMINSHNLDASLILRLTPSMNISFTGSTGWETGYEEWTKGLTVNFNYSVF